MTTLRRHPILFLFLFAFTAWSLLWARLAWGAPVVPDPADHPVEFWSVLSSLRESGGLYLAIAVAMAAVARSLSLRLRPSDGSAPSGWRGRTISTLATVALVATAVVDLILGSLNGTGLAVAVAGGAGILMDPRDPPPRMKPAAIATVALVMLFAVSGCESARARAGNAARVGLDCTTSSLAAAAMEAGGLAKAAIMSAISNDGQPDTLALREAVRGVKRDSIRCAFAAALAALAAPVPRSADAPQASGLEIDGEALRAAGRAVMASEWGLSGAIITTDGVL